jgi:hypothetical protein
MKNNGIARFAGEWVLRRKLTSFRRDKEVQSLKTAKSVGLIFNATLREDLDKVHEFIAWFKQKGIVGEGLGIVDADGSTQFYTPEKNLCYLTVKEINWMGIPFGPNVNDFLSMNFDVLINLTEGQCFAVKYLISLSVAKYKVGLFSPNETIYDLMIQIDPDAEPGEFIKQVKHYLSQIQPAPKQETNL